MGCPSSKEKSKSKESKRNRAEFVQTAQEAIKQGTPSRFYNENAQRNENYNNSNAHKECANNNGTYVTRRFVKPVVRCNSWSGDDSLRYYHGSVTKRDRFQSLNNVNVKTKYEKQHSPDYTSDNIVFHSNTFIKKQSSSQNYLKGSAGNVYDEIIHGGLKRNSFEDDYCNEELPSMSTSNDIYGDKPCVKRKLNIDLRSKNCYRNDNVRTYLQLNDTNDHKIDITNNDVKIQLFRNANSDKPFHVLDILWFPTLWSIRNLDKTGYVDISSSSPEGTSVQNYFNRTSKSKDFELHITGISRIESPFLHSLYLLKKEEMESRNEHVDELYLYHGTKKACLAKICQDNLNWRLFSENHRFGQGVSFSPYARYSSHYSDNTVVKIMLLFKVLVSNVVIGSSDMTVPPSLNHVTYDTSIKEDTTVIVKYSDNEFYPLYKIMYTKRMNVKIMS